MDFLIEPPKHLSPSTINAYIEYRTTWYLQKVKGKIPFINSPAMARGSAVEAGIQHFLSSDNPDFAQSTAVMMAEYDKKTVGCEENLNIRQSLVKCLRPAIDKFLQTVDMPKYQTPIKTNLAGCRLPIIGFLDFEYDDLIIDTKVVSQTPKQNKQAYIIQGAIYKKATGKNVTFRYIVPLKDKVTIIDIPLGDEDARWGLQMAAAAAQQIELIYDHANYMDGKLLDAFFFPNPDAMYNAEEIATVMSCYGL